MIDYKYYEYDGMDPGLEVSYYDGAEYELDDFGERIGDDDVSEDLASDTPAEDDLASASPAEKGFRETIKPDDTGLDDQNFDEGQHQGAKSDYPAESEEGQVR